MFKLQDNNQKVGNYLNSLIIQKYTKVRRFCIAYLQKAGNSKPSDEEIGKMQNRMSQIIKGNKAEYSEDTFINLWKGGWLFMDEDNIIIGYV